MKKNISFKRMSSMLLLIFLGGLFFLSSCGKDDDGLSTGAPIIERVRFTNPDTKDSAFVKATLGSTLAIVGQNLASTQIVYLNDYPIGVNPVFATNTHLIVQITDSVPTIAVNQNVSNTLRVINSYGETTFSFQTLPPAPIVEQIGNQYAKAGESLTLFGKYFYFVDTVYFPGDVFVTEGISTSSNGSSLTVTVPEGFNPTDGDLDVMVSSQSGNSKTDRRTRFFDGDGMFADFDTNGALVWPDNWGWGISPDNVTDATPGNVITPISGNFGMINFTLPPNYGWANEKVINLVNWGGQQIFPTEPDAKYNEDLPIANFDARFEIAVTGSTLDGIAVQLWHPNGSDVELTTENIPLSDFVKSNDGQWYTFSIPLSAFVNGSSKLSTYGDFLAGNSNSEHHFRIVIANTTEDTPKPVVMAIDNVRIVNATYTPAN